MVSAGSLFATPFFWWKILVGRRLVPCRGIFYVIRSTQSHRLQFLEIFNFLVKPVRETDHLHGSHARSARLCNGTQLNVEMNTTHYFSVSAFEIT